MHLTNIIISQTKINTLQGSRRIDTLIPGSNDMISAKNCGTSAMWLELFKANYGCGQAESKANLLVVGIQTTSSQNAQTISLHLKIFKKGILDYINSQ